MIKLHHRAVEDEITIVRCIFLGVYWCMIPNLLHEYLNIVLVCNTLYREWPPKIARDSAL